MSSSSQNEFIIYPEGCKHVYEGMKNEKLLRRLNVLASTFQNMSGDQEDSDSSSQTNLFRLKPLCTYLTDDYFLEHESCEVRILIANIIADILRVYAPFPPYENGDTIRAILEFLIGELNGLKSSNGRIYTRSFYLLENLIHSKSFNLFFALETYKDLQMKLFETMFKLVSKIPAQRIKRFILDLLEPLLDGVVSPELLNVILQNLLEPGKSRKPEAYELSQDLLRRCSSTIDLKIQRFINGTLLNEFKTDLIISDRMTDLIGELHRVFPHILTPVWPQVEIQIRHELESVRMSVVNLLSRLFSEQGSTLAKEQQALWYSYLGRFNDISKDIRLNCIQTVGTFFLNHEALRNDLLEVLKIRFSDTEEIIRFELIKEFINVGMKDLAAISFDKELLDLIALKSKDKKFNVRRETVQGFGRIYQKYIQDLGQEVNHERLTWMGNVILRSWNSGTMNDKLVVERVLVSRLIGYKSDVNERMLKLVYLYLNLDDVSSRAFKQIQLSRYALRMKCFNLLRFVESNTWTTNETENLDRHLVIQITKMAAFFPEPTKASNQLVKLGKGLKSDKVLCNLLNEILDPETDCQMQLVATNSLLRKMGPAGPKNLYYQCIKVLMERITSVIIDKNSITKLIQIVHQLAEGETELLRVLDVTDQEAGLRNGLQLLNVLAPVNAYYFQHEGQRIVQLLEIIPSNMRPILLTTLKFIGMGKKLGPECMEVLVPYCQEAILEGNGKDIKAAVRCLAANIQHDSVVPAFNRVLPILQSYLVEGHPKFEYGIIALGHIAQLFPVHFRSEMRKIMKKIVKSVLDNPEGRKEIDSTKNTGEWCEKLELPISTRLMIQGMKALVRWLIGLERDKDWPTQVNQIFIDFIEDKIKPKYPFSRAEKSWLRLTAGTSFFKLSRFRGVGDAYTPIQMCRIAALLADEVPEVRSALSLKHTLGLSRGPASKWYPVEFLSMYVMFGYEKDRKLKQKTKNWMKGVFKLRLDHIQELKMKGDSESLRVLPEFMPEYILVFAIPYLSVFNPHFTDHTDVGQLSRVKTCLWYTIEPLLKLETYSYSFFRELIGGLKNCTNGLLTNDSQVDLRMYAVCDLIMGILLNKSSTIDSVVQSPGSTQVAPKGYFVRINENNYKSYLPQDMNFDPSPKAKSKTGYRWKYMESEDEDEDPEATRLLNNTSPHKETAGAEATPSKPKKRKILNKPKKMTSKAKVNRDPGSATTDSSAPSSSGNTGNTTAGAKKRTPKSQQTANHDDQRSSTLDSCTPSPVSSGSSVQNTSAARLKTKAKKVAQQSAKGGISRKKAGPAKIKLPKMGTRQGTKNRNSTATGNATKKLQQPTKRKKQEQERGAAGGKRRKK